MSLKKLSFLLFLSAIAGAIISNLVLPSLARVNVLGIGKLVSKINKSEIIITKIEQKSSSTYQVSPFLSAIEKSSPSIVGIQSFNGSNLIRSGTGVILTQDGLVVTTNLNVPTESNFIQIVNQNKILRGKVVFRDFSRGLVMISIFANLPNEQANNFSVVSLNSDPPVLGQKLMTISKVVNFGRDYVNVQETIVGQVNNEANKISLSLPYSSFLFGAAVVDENANLAGLVDFQNQKSYLVTAKKVSDFLNSYLTKPANT